METGNKQTHQSAVRALTGPLQHNRLSHFLFSTEDINFYMSSASHNLEIYLFCTLFIILWEMAHLLAIERGKKGFVLKERNNNKIQK